MPGVLEYYLQYTDTEPLDNVETYEIASRIVEVPDETIISQIQSQTSSNQSGTASNDPALIAQAKNIAQQSGLTLTQFFLLVIAVILFITLIIKE